jgi:hypothetical protein
MRLIAYQALLRDQQNVAHIHRFRQEIERAGGRLTISAPNKVGMVLIILELPEGLTPDRIFGGMPFYPM